MDELLGTLLWVKLELVVRLRVPEHRDSISLGLHKVVLGIGYGLPFSCCLSLLGLDQVGELG